MLLWPDPRPSHTIMARATGKKGRRQPDNAHWNVLGYGNNGIREHAIVVQIVRVNRLVVSNQW